MKNENIYFDYDVSSEQKRIYIFEKLNGNTIIYNMPSIVKLNNKIDFNHIQSVINKITDRQQSLRTSFHMVNGKLFQRVHSKIEPKIKMYSLSGYNSASDIMEEFVKPFELDKAPLFRVAIIVGDDCDYLLLDSHHIISDGKSEKIFLNEFNSLLSGKELPEIKMQYHDYVNQQNKIMNSKRIDIAKKFWMDKFKNPIETLALPTDFPRPELQSFNGSKELFEVDENITALVKDFCKRNKIFANQFLLTALIVTLYRITGQEDIVVGVPVSTRRTAAQNSIIGVFINMLLIRAFPQKNKTFSQLLDEVSHYFLSAVLFQDYSIDKLAHDIDFPKDLSRNHLFDVTFVFNSDITLDPQNFAQYYTTKSSKSDLTFEIIDYSDSTRFLIEYCTDLFTPETCRKFGNYYINVIKQIALLPEIKLIDIPRISENEKNKILFEWNNTGSVYDRNDTVNDLLSKQFQSNDGNALIFGKESLTYRQLESNIDKFASYLRSNGIGRENIVAIMMEPSIDMVIAILGIIKAGGAYLPIDKKTPKNRADFILNDSNAKIIISDEPLRTDAVVFSNVKLPELNGKIDNINKPGDLLYVIYTSGSTGTPKGVMVKHENVCNFVYAMKNSIHMQTHKCILLLTTVCFDISVLEMIVPLTLGMEIVIASRFMQDNMRSILECIKTNNIDILQFTPSRFSMLTLFENWDSYFDSVKTILIGGESFPESLLPKLRKLNNVEVFNMYGPTETTIWSTVSKLDLNDSRITIGTPINNTQVYILNDNMECVLPNEVGTIFIGGYGVTRGYINLPDLTAEKFINNPFKNDIIYDTGDLGSWDKNGNIIYLGRKDLQVKIRGYRIETSEIEHIIESISGINQAVVDYTENDGEKFLCAYYTGTQISDTLLRNELRNFLPEYMLPSYYVHLEKIPLNANGKVDRHELLPPQKNNSNENMRSTVDNRPANELEIQIQAVWKKVLNRESIDVNDDFFDIGGNSILAIQSDVLFEQYHLPIHGHTIYQFRTIRKIAQHLNNNAISENVKVKDKDKDKDILFDAGSVIISEIEPYKKMFFESCFYNSMFSILKSYDVDIEKLVEFYSMDYILKKDGGKLKITASGEWQCDFDKLLRYFGVEYVAAKKCSDIINSIKKSIDDGFPVILWIDCYYESYRVDKYRKEHFPHTLTIYGFNETKQCFYILEQEREDALIYRKTSIPFSELKECYNGFLKYFNHFKKNDDEIFYKFMKINGNEFLNIPHAKNEYHWNYQKLKAFFENFKSVNVNTVNSEYLYELIDGFNQIINCLRIEKVKSDNPEKTQSIQSKLELWEKLRANTVKCYFKCSYNDNNHATNIGLLRKIAVLEGVDVGL